MTNYTIFSLDPTLIEHSDHTTEEGVRLFRRACDRVFGQTARAENYLEQVIINYHRDLREGILTVPEFIKLLGVIQDYAPWMMDDRMAEGKLVHKVGADDVEIHPWLWMVPCLMSPFEAIWEDLPDESEFADAVMYGNWLKFLRNWAEGFETRAEDVVYTEVGGKMVEVANSDSTSTFLYLTVQYLRGRNMLVITCEGFPDHEEKGMMRLTIKAQKRHTVYELAWTSPDGKPFSPFMIENLIADARDMGGELSIALTGKMAPSETLPRRRGGVDEIEL